jgi:transposase
MSDEPAAPRSLDIPNELWQATPLEMRVIFVQREERLRELERRLGTNSTNSSKPPSSDGPQVDRSPKAPPSGKRPGGQKGNPGTYRPIVPVEEVDVVRDHVPQVCRACGDQLCAVDESGPVFTRHQVTEIPAMRATVTEHRLHERRCASCGCATQAKLPPGISRSAFGPRVQAHIACLTGRYRMSRREVREYLDQAWAVRLSLGSVHAIEQEMSRALRAPYEAVWESVKAASVRNVDETTWRVGRKRRWLWGAVSSNATAFTIAASRGAVVLRERFGEALRSGFFCSDRYAAYGTIEMEHRGICHAHLKRDFTRIEQLGGYAGFLGYALLLEHRKVFALVRERRAEVIAEAAFAERIVPLQERIRGLLEQGRACTNAQASGMCANILRHWEAMWNFVSVPGLEPTNNRAERALRKAVLWRKGSFGTRSTGGSEFAERMLTVAATCRQQGTRLLEFLTAALEASRLGVAAPVLVAAAT